MQWRIAQKNGKAIGIDEAAADVAIVYAVERGWLIAEATRRTASTLRMRPKVSCRSLTVADLGPSRYRTKRPPAAEFAAVDWPLP